MENKLTNQEQLKRKYGLDIQELELEFQVKKKKLYNQFQLDLQKIINEDDNRKHYIYKKKNKIFPY